MRYDYYDKVGIDFGPSSVLPAASHTLLPFASLSQPTRNLNEQCPF